MILELPKNWLASMTKPRWSKAFRAKEAFHPLSCAQCPALKKPAWAKEYPPNNSRRGNCGTDLAAGAEVLSVGWVGDGVVGCACAGVAGGV